MAESEARKLMEKIGPHEFLRMLHYVYGIQQKIIAKWMKVDRATVKYYLKGLGAIKAYRLDNLLVALEDINLPSAPNT